MISSFSFLEFIISFQNERIHHSTYEQVNDIIANNSQGWNKLLLFIVSAFYLNNISFFTHGQWKWLQRTLNFSSMIKIHLGNKNHLTTKYQNKLNIEIKWIQMDMGLYIKKNWELSIKISRVFISIQLNKTKTK